jgi:hypothetical protein
MSCGDPIDPPHDEKRFAKDGGIVAREERFGNRNLGRESRLQHGEFLQSVEARGNSGRGGRAKDEPLISDEKAA